MKIKYYLCFFLMILKSILRFWQNFYSPINNERHFNNINSFIHISDHIPQILDSKKIIVSKPLGFKAGIYGFYKTPNSIDWFRENDVTAIKIEINYKFKKLFNCNLKSILLERKNDNSICIPYYNLPDGYLDLTNLEYEIITIKKS